MLLKRYESTEVDRRKYEANLKHRGILVTRNVLRYEKLRKEWSQY